MKKLFKKLKVITIVGTRPEIIRLSEVIKKCYKHFDHKLIFTNQNYSKELSEIFFKDLKLKNPEYHLKINNKSVGKFYGDVLIHCEKIFKEEKPNAIIILGDTNSSIASLVAKRLKIPVFHLEAGNRSFDNNVPEELNRRMVDHISDFNLVYTHHAKENLIAEGLDRRKIFLIGSPLNEVLINCNKEIQNSKILKKLNLNKNKYFIVSLHREENIDNKTKLKDLIESLIEINKKFKMKIVLTNHPRFNKKNSFLKNSKDIIIHKPFGYYDYMNLQINSFCALSDSGTISEESSILKFNAICVRNSMERPETLDNGNLILSGVKKENIINSIKLIKNLDKKNLLIPRDYQIKDTSNRVIKLIQSLSHIKDNWFNIDK